MKKFILFLCLILPTACYADIKISALTTDNAPTRDNYAVEVDDPTGTPSTKKITLGSLADLASINWGSINGLITNQNWLSATPYLNRGAINWSGVIGNVIPGAGMNWTDVVGLIKPANSFAAGQIPIANLATGTPDGTKFLRDDGTLQTPAGGGSGTVSSGTADRVAIYDTAGTTVTSSSVITDNNTNIGIGSVNPIQKLDVNGSINVGGSIPGIIATAGFGIDGHNSGIQDLYVTSASRVGIGTIAPGSTLEIQKIGTDNLFAVSSGAGLNGDIFTIDNGTGNIGIGTSLPFTGALPIVSIYGNTSTAYSAGVSGQPFVWLANGNTTDNSTAGYRFATANGTSKAITNMGGMYGIFTKHTSGDMRSEIAFVTAGSATTNEVMRITNGQNVGISSTAPGQKLDIIGTVRAIQFIGDGSALTGVGGVSGLTTNKIAKAASSTTVTDSQLFDDGTNVGIGTVVPSVKFQINNNILPFTVDSNSNVGIGTNIISNAALSVMNGNVGIGTWKSVASLHVIGNMQVGTSGNFLNVAPAANSMIIQGNVGIGTAATANVLNIGPSANTTTGLSVNGGRVLFGYNATTSNANITSTSTKGFEVYVNGSASSMASGAAAMTILASGNVGIGTVNPINKLSVLGNIGIGTVANDSYMSTVAPNGGAIIYGNVGIGSWAPQSALTLGGIGHFGSTGTAPTVASNDCGSTAQGTITAGSTDLRGSVNVGTLTVTSCAVTFNTVFGKAPVCITQDDTNILGTKNTQTTAKLTITSTTSMSSDVVSWICIE